MAEPVDFSKLRGMLGDDQALLNELFIAFQFSADLCLSGLQTSFHKNDSESWRKHAHALKGLALDFGAMPLGAFCDAAEKDHMLPNSDKHLMLLNIETEYAQVKAVISQNQ